MAESVPENITLNVQLTADDYARYHAVVGKRQSTAVNLAIYVGTFLAAVVVALACRALGALLIADRQAIELIGRFSLLSCFAGIIAIVVAGWIMRRTARTRMLANTPYAFEPKLVAFNTDHVSMTGKLSQASWRWAAITQLTTERGLVLLWIGAQAAIVIPDTAFATPGERNDALALARSRMAAT